MGAPGPPRGCSSHSGCLGCSAGGDSSAQGGGGTADAGELPDRGAVMGRAAGESLWPNNGSLESMHVSCFHRGKIVKCTWSSNFYEENKKQNNKTRKRKEHLKPVCHTVYSEGALLLLIKTLTLAVLLLFSISMLKKHSYSCLLE